MLEIKLETQFNNYCELTITDTTGFVASLNPGGFIQEGVVPSANNQHHISDGYFFNILAYNAYNCTPKILNPTEAPIHVNSVDVEPVYADNNFVYTYTLKTDGRHTFTRIFIMTKAFYESKNLSFFEGKTIIYYDPTVDKIYKLNAGVPEELTRLQLLLTLSPTWTGDYNQTSLLSTCRLNILSYQLETKLLNSCILVCYQKIDKQLIAARDYVYMLLNVIDYMNQLDQTDEIQRLLESSSSNCGLFADLVKDTNLKDCNCG